MFIRSPHPTATELPSKKVILLIIILGIPIILAGPEAYNYYDWKTALILNILYCFSISTWIGIFGYAFIRKIFTGFDRKSTKKLFIVPIEVCIIGICCVAIINQLLWAKVQIADLIEPHQTKTISSWSFYHDREGYFPGKANRVIYYLNEYSVQGTKTTSYPIGANQYIYLVAELGDYNNICESSICHYQISVEYLPNTKRIVSYLVIRAN